MEDALLNNINDIDIEYTIVVKTMDDIIYNITDDPKEKLIYESIINGIEGSAADAIKNGKIAQLPSIGCVRKSPVRKVIQDNYDNLKIARKNMTSDQYKEHVREIVIDAKQNQEKIDYNKSILRKVRSRNKKVYDKYYITLGKAYAEMYIHSILMLKEVPYDSDVQEAFDNINGL